MSTSIIEEPWLSFLREVDRTVNGEVVLHCLGGFAMRTLYHSKRETADLDFVGVVPNREGSVLVDIGGKGTPLSKKYRTYFDFVSVVTLPEDYSLRLREIPSNDFVNLRLYALDPYDLALSKLERNWERDRVDVLHLARTVPLDLDVLRERYVNELRVYMGIAHREDLTLRLWIEMIEEERSQTKQISDPPEQNDKGFIR